MKKKILQLTIVIAIMILSYGAYLFVAINGGEKPPETISASSLSQGINPVGYFSDGWATEIVSAEAFHNLTVFDTVVVTGTDVIPTGVYKRKSWIGPYDAGSTSTKFAKRRKTPIPTETITPLTDIEYMNQYVLIQLSDGSYINAILENQYIEKIQKERSVKLPIGIPMEISNQSVQLLSEITKAYEVEATPCLYMIADDWYRENQSKIQMKAMFWGIGTFIVLIVFVGFAFGRIFDDEI